MVTLNNLQRAIFLLSSHSLQRKPTHSLSSGPNELGGPPEVPRGVFPRAEGWSVKEVYESQARADRGAFEGHESPIEKTERSAQGERPVVGGPKAPEGDQWGEVMLIAAPEKDKRWRREKR
ncbi:hypothetical protein SRHO_G00222560 [Serrasalmus rhombeus]